MGNYLSAVNTKSNKRSHYRSKLSAEIEVNDGTPFQGGVLHDISVSGAAIAYPPAVESDKNPLEIGQALILKMGNGTKLPAKIVRIFEEGFATKFDFSLDQASI